MVAYNFKERFCSDIARGIKRQTIRAPRVRHARPGEPVQLFFGMRNKHCRKLIDPDPVCLSVEPITLIIPHGGSKICSLALLYDPEDDDGREITDEFAQADGFASAQDMTHFWQKAHGSGRFDGVLIKWEMQT